MADITSSKNEHHYNLYHFRNKLNLVTRSFCFHFVLFVTSGNGRLCERRNVVGVPLLDSSPSSFYWWRDLWMNYFGVSLCSFKYAHDWTLVTATSSRCFPSFNRFPSYFRFLKKRQTGGMNFLEFFYTPEPFTEAKKKVPDLKVL